MTAIRVRCETCQATLRVRDAGFVGEVHACPRCGSMVLIAGGRPEGGPDAPADGPVTLGLSGELDTLEAPELAAPELASSGPLDPPAPREPIPAPAERSLASAWAPTVATLTTLAATAAVLATWGSRSAAPVPEPSPSPVAQAEPAAPAPPGREEPAATEPTPALPDAAKPLDVAEPLDAAEPPGPADTLPPEPVATPQPLAANEPEPAAPAIAQPTAVEIDPLAFDASEIDYALTGAAPPERPEVEITREPAPTAEPIAPERPAVTPPRDGVLVSLVPSGPDDAPPAADAVAALAMVLPSIDLRGVPLDEACRLVSDLSGVPVTLSPTALRRAGVRGDRPVDLVGTDVPLAAALHGALAPVRLSILFRGDGALVVRRGESEVRTITHHLADLVGTDPTALAAELREEVGVPPGLAIDPRGELPLTAPMGVHYDLLVAAERLRVRRGLEPQSKYPAELLAAEPAERLRAVLDRRTTFSFVTPVPLVEVFDHWRRVTRVPVLIDWPALASAGLGPRSRVVCSVTNRPWRVALDGVLGPLGLAWRTEFGDTLWVTAAAE